MELEPIRDGEHREGITFVAEPAGCFRMVHTSEIVDVDEIEHRTLMRSERG